MSIKALFLSFLPFVVGAAWVSLVIGLTILTITVFRGGHPPFAIFPLVANIAGTIVIYPICIILSGIGKGRFRETEVMTVSITARTTAVVIVLFAVADATFCLTYEMAVPFYLFLSLAHPLFFFKHISLLDRLSLRTAWLIGVPLLFLALYLGKQYLMIVIIASISNLISLWGRFSERFTVTPRPAVLCRITFTGLILAEALGLPAALFLR
ncbi:MAG TPA: hypothetical protein PKM25_04860 [Candidatus Ozemobacteraceae bacterium]|nr:hypothetical protein [Candidatus Ozemobacteraceae bacterium]